MSEYIKRVGWIVVALSGCLMLAVSAQAASFDCAKVQSKVEHLICDDPEISKLDDEMAAAYKVAVQDQRNADSIRLAQKHWLKARNGCEEAVCIKDAYLTRLFSLRQIPIIADSTLLLTGHAEFTDEADKLKFMRNIVGQHKFYSPKYSTNTEFCQQFLKDFGASNELVQATEPDVRTVDEQDPRLKNWHQCENSEQKAENIPEYRFLNILGGPPYRYYQIDIDGNPKNGKEDVIYTETYKPGTHSAGTGLTGYVWVDLKECVPKGGAAVDFQYPPKPLAADIYHVNTVVKYRGNYLAVDLYPRGKAYGLHATSFDAPNGQICLWFQQENFSGEK